jgi:flagellar protein FliS
MWQNAHDTYFESRVLSADPIELVGMLYQAATGAVGEARRHLAAGDIAARARAISKASAILIELATSLDHERGGQISANLARLYDYMLRRLTDANLQQSDVPLAEVLGLLATLSEGWEGVKAQRVGALPPSHDAASALPASPKPAADAGNSWSQPEAPESPATYGNSWTQPAPESPATYGNAWSQPAAPEPTATDGTSWSQPTASESPASPASSWARAAASESPATYASSWARAAASDMSAAFAGSWSTASPEPRSGYGSSWADPASPESAIAYQNPWAAPASEERPSAYGNAWPQVLPQEPATAQASHDWSF